MTLNNFKTKVQNMTEQDFNFCNPNVKDRIVLK